MGGNGIKTHKTRQDGPVGLAPGNPPGDPAPHGLKNTSAAPDDLVAAINETILDVVEEFVAAMLRTAAQILDATPAPPELMARHKRIYALAAIAPAGSRMVATTCPSLIIAGSADRPCPECLMPMREVVPGWSSVCEPCDLVEIDGKVDDMTAVDYLALHKGDRYKVQIWSRGADGEIAARTGERREN